MSGARLSVYAADAGLKVPFVISGHTWNSHPYIIVELEDGRQLARGEAAGVYYRAETADSMMHQVRSVASGIEAGVDRRTLRHVLPAGGARNAIDCALVDLESQRQGIPAWQCLGLPKPAPLETFLTITADTPKAMGETAATTLGQAGRIKLKLTGDASLDTERLAAVRTARPDAELAVDANCGYRPDTLAPLLDGIEAAKVRLLEQPCPPEYDAELRGLDWP
ncbi:MAG: enolase C-terminal domain-like protein, partial [Pseudomonadota bacterium]